MKMSDMGMINVFRNYFQLLRFKYSDGDGSYKRQIDYEELSNCFVYPSKAIQNLGLLNQFMIDKIIHHCKERTAVTRGKYNIVRLGL